MIEEDLSVRLRLPISKALNDQQDDLNMDSGKRFAGHVATDEEVAHYKAKSSGEAENNDDSSHLPEKSSYFASNNTVQYPHNLIQSDRSCITGGEMT